MQIQDDDFQEPLDNEVKHLDPRVVKRVQGEKVTVPIVIGNIA